MNTHSVATRPSEQDHFDRARDFQEHYDNSMREVGVRIPAPVLGQSANDYRRATLAALQRTLLPIDHKLAQIDVRDLKSDSLQALEPQLLAACAEARTSPRNVPPGQLKPIKVRDSYGRLQETKFIGSYVPAWNTEESFVKQIGRAGRRVVSITAASTGQVWDAFKGAWIK